MSQASGAPAHMPQRNRNNFPGLLRVLETSKVCNARLHLSEENRASTTCA